MDPKLIMAAVNERREKLGALTGRQALSLVEVAAQIGVHSAMFSRLNKGILPSEENIEKLMFWLGDPDRSEFTECAACPADHSGAQHPDDDENPSIVASEDAVDGKTFAEGDEDEPEEEPTETTTDGETDPTKTATIYGSGALSNSKDPETQAAVARVRELLSEGAVGVSIMHDMDPSTMPSEEDYAAAQKKAWEQDDWSDLEELEKQIKSRPRHVAIVDTPAFSDAKLTLAGDGTVSGPIAFEGAWTGDGRRLPYESLQWNDELLPIAIIWDRQDGDHTGMTVGLIDTIWREDGGDSAVRDEPVTEEEAEAVVAASALEALPAAYFQRFATKGPTPLQVDAPDKNGLRRVWGHAAPKGTCHRSGNGGCFQYPGDVDPTHKGFHTGAAVTLDSGETIRVGALTMGGAHIDPKLAKQGVRGSDLGTHRDNANRTVAMVRAWEDNYGLAISGVLMPDTSDADLLRMMSSAPSVELWPERGGLTLVGIHLVPTPAWPVTASIGSAEVQAGITASVAVELESDLADEPTDSETSAQIAELIASNSRIEKALALILEALDSDVPEPGEPTVEGDENGTDAD